jgi:N-acetylmuramoyl-L-alanine amidase
MNRIVLVFVFLFVASVLHAQNGKTFLKLVTPSKLTINTQTSRQFLIGNTCSGCTITVNKTPVKVYKTGSFAYELNLELGETSFTVVASGGNTSAVTRTVSYAYTLPSPPDTVKTLLIASLDIQPAGDLLVQPGDVIRIKAKSMPGIKLTTLNNTPLEEMVDDKMPGIYQGEYMVQSTDSFKNAKIAVTATNKSGMSVTRTSQFKLSSIDNQSSTMLVSKGRLAHLLFGIGEDRLGGAKMGYIDSLIPLKMLGKVGPNYKVQLSKNRTAYIPDDVVSFIPKGNFSGSSLTDKWQIYGDDNFDYVRIGMFARLPYQSMQLVSPSKIIVDIFGATNNTNWITQLQSAKEVKNAWYEQIEDDVLRITIELKHQQHWGHSIYYRGNNLIIRIKQQPKNLSLDGLVIGVDAGHGGSNIGGAGPSGIAEKTLTLAVAIKLQKALEAKGAKVIMSRNAEKFFDNKERILFYRDSLPDLLVSIHLNSSEDPIYSGGTSTYYRYIGFKPLSHHIYTHLLDLGLKDYGNTGSFNFMLNSPIEYPNALVEALFLSNPEEEEKIVDPQFQQQLADKIVLGVEDFLQEVAQQKQI